jgi:hypothetical protein
VRTEGANGQVSMQKAITEKTKLENTIRANRDEYRRKGEFRSKGNAFLAIAALLLVLVGAAFILVGRFDIFPWLGQLLGRPKQAVGYGVFAIVAAGVIGAALDLYPLNDKGKFYRGRADEFQDMLTDVETFNIKSKSEEEALAGIQDLNDMREARVTQITDEAPQGLSASSVLVGLTKLVFRRPS